MVGRWRILRDLYSALYVRRGGGGTQEAMWHNCPLSSIHAPLREIQRFHFWSEMKSEATKKRSLCPAWGPAYLLGFWGCSAWYVAFFFLPSGLAHSVTHCRAGRWLEYRCSQKFTEARNSWPTSKRHTNKKICLRKHIHKKISIKIRLWLNTCGSLRWIVLWVVQFCFRCCGHSLFIFLYMTN